MSLRWSRILLRCKQYADLTVVFSLSPSSSLVPEAVREVIGGAPDNVRTTPYKRILMLFTLRAAAVRVFKTLNSKD